MAPTYSTIPTTPDADEESLLVNASKDAKPRLRLGAAAVVMAFALGATVAYVAPSKSTTSASLASSQDCVGSSCSPLGVAKAWKAYSNGDYADDCVNAMAIALGEGAMPYNPITYIHEYCVDRLGHSWKDCFEGPGGGEGSDLSFSQFLHDIRIFDLNQEPQYPGDEQKTLGPWQTMTTVLNTDDIDVRIGEAVDYVMSNCNPNCPRPRENRQCENPFEGPEQEYCKRDGDCPVTVIFDSPNLNWCGCATTSSPDPEKQTLGYSGRCVNAAADYYTKYKDFKPTDDFEHSLTEGLAVEICKRA